MATSYKYLAIMQELQVDDCCPYNGCSSMNITGYRWAVTSEDVEDSYLPKHLFDSKFNKRPPRAVTKPTNKFKCSICGLSMYESADAAKNKFNMIKDNSLSELWKDMAISKYTHLLEVNISEDDGVVSTINEHGHFDFFEFVENGIRNRSIIICEL